MAARNSKRPGAHAWIPWQHKMCLLGLSTRGLMLSTWCQSNQKASRRPPSNSAKPQAWSFLFLARRICDQIFNLSLVTLPLCLLTLGHNR
jgi:hypothetical protein